MSEMMREISDERKTLAERLMREKYGTEFTAVKTNSQSSTDFYVWLVSPKLPGCTIKAALNDDGSCMSDNLPMVRLCRNITGLVNWELRQYSGGHFVHTSNILEYSSPDLIDITPGEYLKEYPFDRFDISVFINTEDIDFSILYNSLIQLRNKLQQENITKGFIDIYAVSGDQIKKIITTADCRGGINDTEIALILSKGGRASISLDTSDIIPTESDFRKGIEK